MANASVLPFGGAQSLEVAYGAGINLISNMYTAGRMEAPTRSLLYPTVVAIVDGLAATERLWLTKQSTLAADTSLPEARRRIHSGTATRSRIKVISGGIEGSAAAVIRIGNVDTAITPTGTKSRRSVVVARP